MLPPCSEVRMSAGEKSYFANGGVQITNKRAIFHSKTYAMRNISSVSLGRIPASRKVGILIALAGIAIGGCAGAAEAWEGLAFGLLVVGVGALAAWLPKDRFVVQLSSSSGEIRALVSKDRDFASGIVNALNEAIIEGVG